VPYRLQPDETVLESIQRIALEQIDRAEDDLAEYDTDPGLAVHEARKRFKKIRGLVRLVRPALGKTYKTENAWFRDQARRIAGVRDAAAMVECLDRLAGKARTKRLGHIIEKVRAKLDGLRAEMEKTDQLDQAVQDIVERLELARRRVQTWQLKSEGFKAIAGGLGKTYARARKDMAAAFDAPCPEAFHEWRKRVKYHRYHCRLLRNLWQPVLIARRDQAKRLSDLLGWDHDLAVLRDHLGKDPRKYATEKQMASLDELADAVHQEWIVEAKGLGCRLLAEPAEQFIDRVRTYYRAWREAGGLTPQQV
jgi:CHAD domain-containing protein